MKSHLIVKSKTFYIYILDVDFNLEHTHGILTKKTFDLSSVYQRIRMHTVPLPLVALGVSLNILNVV